MVDIDAAGDDLAVNGLVRTCERLYSTDSSLNIVPKVGLNLQEHTSIEYNLQQDLSKQTENPYLTDIAGLGEDAVSKIIFKGFKTVFGPKSIQMFSKTKFTRTMNNPRIKCSILN